VLTGRSERGRWFRRKYDKTGVDGKKWNRKVVLVEER
jgi:hypothetical protein